MILFRERVLNLVLLDILCLIFQGEMFNMSITNVLHKKFCTYFWITLLSEGSEEAFSLSSVSFCRKRGQPAWVRDMLKRPVWSWYRLFTMFFVFFFSKASSKASRNVISLALLAGIEFPQASFLRCLSFQLSCRYDFFHLSPAGLFHLIVIRKKESFLTGLTLGLCDYCVQTLQLFNQNTIESRNLEPYGKWEIVKTNCCNSMYANHNISLLTWRCFISPRFSFFISVKRFDWRSCTISR